jgi:hypothetical protein
MMVTMPTSGPPDEYDVFVVTKQINAVSVQQEWIALGADLTKAQAALRQVREAGGNGLVVPSRYRGAGLSKDDARAVADEAFRLLRQSASDAYSDLGEGGDEGGCWCFSAENYTQQELGLIPGIQSFRIDKLDGHIWSREEATSFWRLSTAL